MARANSIIPITAANGRRSPSSAIGKTARSGWRLGLLAACTCLASGPAARAQDAARGTLTTLRCPELYPGGTVPFTGLFPAIEGAMALTNFQANQIVEIDTTTMPEAAVREQIAALQAIPVRVSIYLPGGHCNIANKDCAAMTSAGLRIGKTGSWNWDKDERRIYNITHPAFISRVTSGAEIGWRLGANYIRVDNIHNPAGSSGVRTAADFKVLFDALHDLEDKLRADGTIPAARPTGVVAHNNLDVWEELIRSGALRRPPVFLTSERTAQLAFKGQGYRGDSLMKRGQLAPTQVSEIEAGRRIAEKLDIPYTVAEFQISHDLGNRPGTTYQLPKRYVDQLAALPGISDVIVIPSENSYIGRGTPHIGPGPKTLAAAPQPANARQLAQACMAR